MKPRHLLCVDDSMSFDGPNATISDTEQSDMCTHPDPLNWTFSIIKVKLAKESNDEWCEKVNSSHETEAPIVRFDVL